MATAVTIPFPVMVPARPASETTRLDVMRDVLEVFRRRGIESRVTPTELQEIANGSRSIESVLL